MSRRLNVTVAAVAVLGLASRMYRMVTETRDARCYPPPGELVDIGGRRLHLCRAGEGTPSVIIVPCLGGPGAEWWEVQRKLAPYTSVYTYDRAGLGWSDPGPWPRTYARMADELHQLLAAAAIPAPYLLVGHSTGGIIARRFAAQHPEGLAGMVLVESSHEDQMHRLAPFTEHLRLNLWRRSLRCLSKPLGILRAAQAAGRANRPTRPVDVISQSARCQRADAQEMITHALSRPGARPPNLGDLPLHVITAGSRTTDEDRETVWRAMQAELAALSTRSTHVVIEHVGHHINRDDPDALVDQIREVVTRLAGQ